jgi:hypothetical protein
MATSQDDPVELIQRSFDAMMHCIGLLKDMELYRDAAPNGYASEGVTDADGLPDLQFESLVAGTWQSVMWVRDNLTRWRETVCSAQVAGLLLPLADSPKGLTRRHFSTLTEAAIDLAGDTLAALTPRDSTPDPPADILWREEDLLTLDPVAFHPLALRIRAALEGDLEKWVYQELHKARNRALARHTREDRPHLIVDELRTACPIRFADSPDKVRVLTSAGTWEEVQLPPAPALALRALADAFPNGLTREDLTAVPVGDAPRALSTAFNKSPAIRAVLRRPEVAHRPPDKAKRQGLHRPGRYYLVNPLQPESSD